VHQFNSGSRLLAGLETQQRAAACAVGGEDFALLARLRARTKHVQPIHEVCHAEERLARRGPPLLPGAMCLLFQSDVLQILA
jgi:hypothetical protein